jgi:hypothetical protein
MSGKFFHGVADEISFMEAADTGICRGCRREGVETDNARFGGEAGICSPKECIKP